MQGLENHMALSCSKKLAATHTGLLTALHTAGSQQICMEMNESMTPVAITEVYYKWNATFS